MEAQPTQVVGDLSGAQLAGLFPQQWSKMLAYILVGKCALDEKEQQQDVQESLHARIGEAQRRGALVIYGDRLIFPTMNNGRRLRILGKQLNESVGNAGGNPSGTRTVNISIVKPCASMIASVTPQWTTGQQP
jgi:hypothetical protein